MPKSRTSQRARVKNRVYSHQRERKPGKAPELIRDFDQLKGLIQHSIEVAKLQIEGNQVKNLIAMLARNNDVMDHIIAREEEHMEWFKNKIEEHTKACIVKMKLFLKKDSEQFKIPEDFHLGTTDLKNGYVSLENKKEQFMAIIISQTTGEFPHDEYSRGTIIPHDDVVLNKLKIESLLKNKDVISNILLRKASILEGKMSGDYNWLCSSVSCLDRKRKINFEDI